MESVKIYEKSYNNLKQLGKEVTGSQIVINFDQFDTETASILREALINTISNRLPQLATTFTGANKI